MEQRKPNILIITLFVIYLLLLTAVILFKLPFYSRTLYDERVINLNPLEGAFDDNGHLLAREMMANILIFIPLGVYIYMLKSKWSFMKKVIPILGLTLAFEGIQFLFAIGRSDINDVICNTLGGIIGIAFYAILFKLFKSSTVRVVNIVALVVTVCVVARFAQLFYLSHFVMRRLHP